MEPISFPCPACCGAAGCCGLTSSDTLYVSGSHTGTLTWNATAERWEGSVTGACTLHVCVSCENTGNGCVDFGVSFNCVSCDSISGLPRNCLVGELLPCDCDPFAIYAQCLQMNQSDGCCNGVDVDMVITL